MKEKRLSIGNYHEVVFAFSQEDVIQFSEITGDKNPIHLDGEYASRTFFEKPIMHGFLCGAVFSKIFGMEFPGEGSIYLVQNLKFLKPMFIENEYRAKCIITKIDKEKNFVHFDTIIEEQKTSMKTITGTAIILVDNKKL